MSGNTRNDPSAPILIIGGSYAKRSATTVLMRYTAKLFEERGMAYACRPLVRFDLPFYHPDLHEKECPPAEFLLGAFLDARAFVWRTPSYHYSISGAFKNAIDFLGNLPPMTIRLISAGGWSASLSPRRGRSRRCMRSARWSRSSTRCAAMSCRRRHQSARSRAAVDTEAGVIRDERTKLKLVQMVGEMCDALAVRT